MNLDASADVPADVPADADSAIPGWVERILDGRRAPIRHLSKLDGKSTFYQLSPTAWLFHREMACAQLGQGAVERMELLLRGGAMTSTYGPAPYTPSQSYGHVVLESPGDAPELVAFCLRSVADYLPTSVDARLYLTAIVQYYRRGSIHLPMHHDDVHPLLAGLPVVSFTFLPDGSLPRAFVVAPNRRADEPGRPSSLHLSLRNGDVVVMGGDMQAHFEHGVPARACAAYAQSRRINVTIHPSSADPMLILQASPLFSGMNGASMCT